MSLSTYRKDSIKPPGAYLSEMVLGWGLIRKRGFNRVFTVHVVSLQVQEQSSQFQIALSLCNTLPSLLVCLIYGSWSDRVGRKPLIVLGMCGALLDTVCVFFTILLDLPLSVMLFGSFLNGIGGYLTGLFLAVMAYVTDTTGREDRPLRLGV